MKVKLLIFSTVTLSIGMPIDIQAGSAQAQFGGTPSQPGANGGSVANKSSADKMLKPRTFGRPGISTFVPQQQEFRKKMLQMFDTNHDGKIDDNERMKMRAARRQRATSDAQSLPGQSNTDMNKAGPTYHN